MSEVDDNLESRHVVGLLPDFGELRPLSCLGSSIGSHLFIRQTISSIPPVSKKMRHLINEDQGTVTLDQEAKHMID